MTEDVSLRSGFYAPCGAPESVGQGHKKAASHELLICILTLDVALKPTHEEGRRGGESIARDVRMFFNSDRYLFIEFDSSV